MFVLCSGIMYEAFTVNIYFLIILICTAFQLTTTFYWCYNYSPSYFQFQIEEASLAKSILIFSRLCFIFCPKCNVFHFNFSNFFFFFFYFRKKEWLIPNNSIRKTSVNSVIFCVSQLILYLLSNSAEMIVP